MVNYGSNLIIRAYNSSGRDLEGLITCGVLLKQVVTMLDGAHLALSHGSVKPAFLSLRASWEASIYHHWVLESDSRRKVLLYYVGNLRNILGWAKFVADRQHRDEAVLPDTMAEGLRDFRVQDREEAAKQVSEIETLLRSTAYSDINALFENEVAKRKKRGRVGEPNWYELADGRSVAYLAKTLRRSDEYKMLYGRGSEVMHAQSYKDHVILAPDRASIRPIRDSHGAREVLLLAYTVALSAYRRTLVAYRPGEVQAWTDKYVSDWRQLFLRIAEMPDARTDE